MKKLVLILVLLFAFSAPLILATACGEKKPEAQTETVTEEQPATEQPAVTDTTATEAPAEGTPQEAPAQQPQ